MLGKLDAKQRLRGGDKSGPIAGFLLSKEPEIVKLHTRHIASASVFLIILLYCLPLSTYVNRFMVFE